LKIKNAAKITKDQVLDKEEEMSSKEIELSKLEKENGKKT